MSGSSLCLSSPNGGEVISRQRCCILCRAKKARVERQAGDSAKRRKMTEELERREKAFASERNEEHAARARLKVCSHFLCFLCKVCASLASLKTCTAEEEHA